ADPAFALHPAIRRLAAQAVRPVVAHRHLVRRREAPFDVHEPRRLVDERPEHLALRVELDERELDPRVRRERLAEGLPDLRVLDRAIDAVLRRAEARGGLPDAVLVEE